MRNLLSFIMLLLPRANSTIASYNATSSLVRFENKNVFLYYENALAYYNAGVGSAPGKNDAQHTIH
jgi:hypothetical protein